MAVIQDLVLTFCPTMHSVQQKKLKLLMPVLEGHLSLGTNDTKNLPQIFQLTFSHHHVK